MAKTHDQQHMQGESERVRTGPGLILALAAAVVALVMLIAFAIARPWESNGGGDPAGTPDQSGTVVPGAQPQGR